MATRCHFPARSVQLDLPSRKSQALRILPNPKPVAVMQSRSQSAAPKVRRAALAFIFITVVLDMLALGVIGDRLVMLAGLWFGVAGFAIYGLARTGAVFWMAAPVSGLWGLSGPPMQGLT